MEQQQYGCSGISAGGMLTGLSAGTATVSYALAGGAHKQRR